MRTLVHMSDLHFGRIDPELLDSLTEVRALIVANTNGEAVLTVNLHESESMRFELSSVFSNTGNDADAIGCLAVSSQSGHVRKCVSSIPQRHHSHVTRASSACSTVRCWRTGPSNSTGVVTSWSAGSPSRTGPTRAGRR